MHTHLILDEIAVAESRGVTFHLNAPTKHPENPVLRPGRADEWDGLQVSWPATVLYCASDRKFRCWYAGLDAMQRPGRFWEYGYAESNDGIHWVKPTLDQVKFLDQFNNQIKPDWITWPADVPVPPWGLYFLSTVFENPLPDAPPSQRFGAYWIDMLWHADTKRHSMVKALAWSPDGIRWKRASTAHEVKPYVRAGLHDICQLVYDPDDADPAYRVKAYAQWQTTRAYDGRTGVRHISLLHGRDFNHMDVAPNPIVLAPEQGIDEEIHFTSVKKIGGTFVMLFESDRFDRPILHGDLRLAVSADGKTFRRVHKQTPFVATGPKGSWEENMLVTSTSAIQEVGDEYYLYYFGTPYTYNTWPAQYVRDHARRGSLFAPACMGLATFPRDRFAYAAGPGTVTTHPLEIDTEGIWLNADGDHLRVTALDEKGAPKAHGRLGAERRQTVYRRVLWDDSEPRGTYRLELALTSSDKLFSIACG